MSWLFARSRASGHGMPCSYGLRIHILHGGNARKCGEKSGLEAIDDAGDAGRAETVVNVYDADI
jgi:hypothetical protein